MPSPAAAFPVRGAEPAPALDAARERVVRLLTDRYADDSLTVDEFEARLDQMHALASVDALDRMALALAAPGAGLTSPGQGPGSQATAHRAPARAAAGHAAGQVAGLLPGRVRAFMSNMRREGAWVVPPQLHLTSVMSEIRLDLREAVLPPVCEVHVYAFMGNVKLYLPPGAEAVVEVESVMASVDDRRARRGQTARGRVVRVVRVTGTVIMGEVKVRHEDW